MLQEIAAIDAVQQMSKAEAERSEEAHSSGSTLKALRRLSFLVPLGDILPEALLVLGRKAGGVAIVCRFCFTTAQNNQWTIISFSFCNEGYHIMNNGVLFFSGRIVIP